MSDSVIRLSGFYYAYPQSDVLLKDINLSVEKGSFTAIAGLQRRRQDDSLPGHDGDCADLLWRPLCRGGRSARRRYPR